MVSVHSPDLPFKVFSQQGAIGATSTDVYTVVAKHYSDLWAVCSAWPLSDNLCFDYFQMFDLWWKGTS